MLRLVRFIIMSVILTLLLPLGNIQSPQAPIPSASAACSIWIFNCDNPTQVPYCNSNDPSSSSYCSIDKGTDIVKNHITDIKRDRRFSEYVQDVVAYLLGFLALIVVLLILWAGFTILTAGGDEDKVKNGKTIIVRAFIGLLIIFLAWAITTFIIGSTSNNSKGLINGTAFIQELQGRFSIPSAYAASANDSRGFDYYRSKIEEAAQAIGRDYEVDGKIKAAHIKDLEIAIAEAAETFPDSEKDFNTSLVNNVSNQIALVRKFPDSDLYAERLAEALRTFITTVRVGAITAKTSATPATGNAPFTVTLRANEARDPSGVPIPESNYVWWIRGAGNTRQIIGKGVSVAYTFRTEGVFTVNLEISSASRNSNGKVDVMPFNGTQEVKVLPKLANILLFINGANVSNTDTYKITPNQGRAGLVIDASSSTPASGATIMRTEWEFGNGNRTAYNGAPRLERQVYAAEGMYDIKLKLITNENPEGVTKIIRLVCQDPIASIRADKTTGFAGDDFKFNASSNLVNAILTYEWSIMEADGGKQLFTSKSQSINYKFPRMGDYVVRLKTMSAGGKEDTDNLRITIDSKQPIANFEVRSASSETPNVIFLDATRSYDPDSLDASKLTFAWTIDGERVDLDNSSRGGALGYYTFTTKGNHTVVLDLANEQGKTAQFKKDFRVDSLLSVKLVATPKISQLGQNVAFVAESKEATVFEWEFGDGAHENTNESRVFHVYKKSGTYDVRLTVRGNADAGASNTISRKIYVTDADSPFAAISVKKWSDVVEFTPDACPSGEAYVVDRSNPITISGVESMNTDGTTDGLTYAWKYQGKTSTQREFSYKFDELGCFPVSLTVRSQKANKAHTSTVYIKVDNALPTFASLTVSSDKPDADPVVVNVTVNNATDPDGVIVSYLWYYYTDSDPEPQDFRITKTPKTAFVIPRTNGKYYFAVTMEDSNGAKLNSDESREERYSITLASDNINTPLVQLKTSSSQIQVGEEVTFQSSVRNVLGQDMTDKVEYKWDYDGDGFYDETTSAPTVKHAYQIPGSFNMKVKATYRGISNTKYQQILVRNEIKPNLEYFWIGNKYVFLNTTTGVYTKVKWTVGDTTSENKDSFVVTLPDDITAPEAVLEVSDGNSTKTTSVSLRKDVINANRVKESKDSVIVFSYPALSDESITVENKNDPVYIYLGENAIAAKYAIDLDTKVDSDLNGDVSDDADNRGTDSYSNGAPFAVKNLDAKKERTIRIALFDASGKKLGTRDIKLILAYQSDTPEQTQEKEAPKNLTDSDKAGLESLKDLIRTKVPEGSRVKFMDMLGQLQENWADDREKTKSIIDFQSAIAELSISEQDKNDFYVILDGFLLTDSETKDDIALATSVLKKLIPASNSHYEEIFGKDGKGGLVGEILSHPTNIDLNKQIGEKILGYIKDDAEIADSDKLILKEQLRVIIYGGAKNVPTATTEANQGSSSGFIEILGNIAIGFLWILAAIIGFVLLLFIFFKVTNRNPSIGFQDFIIERLFGGGKTPSSNPSAPKVAPVVSAAQTPPVVQTPSTIQSQVPSIPESIPASFVASQPNEKLGNTALNDPLAFASPASEPIVQSVDTTEDIQPMASQAASMPVTSAESDDSIPDWLKSTTDRLTSTSEESTLNEPTQIEPSPAEYPETQNITTQDASTVSMGNAIGAPELPSWLSQGTSESIPGDSDAAYGMMPSETPVEEGDDSKHELNTTETYQSDSANETPEAIPEEAPEVEQIPDNSSAQALTPSVSADRTTAPAPASDDLPDWLKPRAGGMQQDSVGEVVSVPSETPEQSESEVVTPTSESVPEKKPRPKKPKTTPTIQEIKPATNTDDLPDWLK